jgi:hypothetical protein
MMIFSKEDLKFCEDTGVEWRGIEGKLYRGSCTRETTIKAEIRLGFRIVERKIMGTEFTVENNFVDYKT